MLENSGEGKEARASAIVSKQPAERQSWWLQAQEETKIKSSKMWTNPRIKPPGRSWGNWQWSSRILTFTDWDLSIPRALPPAEWNAVSGYWNQGLGLCFQDSEENYLFPIKGAGFSSSQHSSPIWMWTRPWVLQEDLDIFQVFRDMNPNRGRTKRFIELPWDTKHPL
jgi:hypothetical protein